MNYLKLILAKVLLIFTSDQAKKALNTAADFTASALPFIDIAARIVVGVTPTTIDDAALAALHHQFPQLFDGSLKTGEELKLYMLAVATELLKAKYPALSTSIARLSVQLAYTGKNA